MSDRSFGQNPGAIFQVVVPASAAPGAVRVVCSRVLSLTVHRRQLRFVLKSNTTIRGFLINAFRVNGDTNQVGWCVYEHPSFSNSLTELFCLLCSYL